MHALGEPFVAHGNGETDGDGYCHQHEVLNQQVTDGQVDAAHLGADIVGGEVHNQRTRKQRDDAAKGRQRYGQRDIAIGKHGEDVTGTAAWTARNEHDAQEEQGC